MSKSETFDAEGNVIQTLVSTNSVTVQASRKLGRENYGNEEFGLFCQLDINEDDDLATIEANIKATAAFLKTIVYEQLGVESTTDDNGIVRDVPRPEKAKASGGRKPATSKPATEAPTDKVAQWQDVIDNPGNWYDNRVDKKNPKGPDFKHKGEGDQPALWLYARGSTTNFAADVPEFVKLWVNGEASPA